MSVSIQSSEQEISDYIRSNMDRNEMRECLENAGFMTYDAESDNDFVEAIVESVKQGDIEL